jgi:hypothetical protein
MDMEKGATTIAIRERAATEINELPHQFRPRSHYWERKSIKYATLSE